MTLGALRSMEEERRRARVHPSHVLLISLQKVLSLEGVPPLETKMAVHRLMEAGRLRIGRTINDFYVEVR